MRALLIGTATTLLVAVAIAAPPLAGSWNITPSGSAASSGDLLFRVTSGGGEPLEITVPVHSGSTDIAVARSIRQALGSQLPRSYRVELGEGANVLISDPRGKPGFSIELINSDIDDMRIAVRSIEAGASPTVPAQSTPANPQPPPTPPQPGAATPPTQSPIEAVPPNAPQPPMTPSPATPIPDNPSQPAAPPPNNARAPIQPGPAPGAPLGPAQSPASPPSGALANGDLPRLRCRIAPTFGSPLRRWSLLPDPAYSRT